MTPWNIEAELQAGMLVNVSDYVRQTWLSEVDLMLWATMWQRRFLCDLPAGITVKNELLRLVVSFRNEVILASKRSGVFDFNHDSWVCLKGVWLKQPWRCQASWATHEGKDCLVLTEVTITRGENDERKMSILQKADPVD